jgi:hypothetical protein
VALQHSVNVIAVHQHLGISRSGYLLPILQPTQDLNDQDVCL